MNVVDAHDEPSGGLTSMSSPSGTQARTSVSFGTTSSSRPGATVDCAEPPWPGGLLFVEVGAVVLSCTVGQLALDQGTVFFVDGLDAPALRNPHPTRATVSIAHPSTPTRRSTSSPTPEIEDPS